MSDESKEIIAAQRAAFIRGAEWGAEYGRATTSGAEAAAKSFYKRKVTRPRVVADPHGYGYWTVGRDMAVRLGNPGDDVFRDVIGHTPNPNCRGVQWLPIHHYVTAERAALWADLLASPLEEVEDDA